MGAQRWSFHAASRVPGQPIARLLCSGDGRLYQQIFVPTWTPRTLDVVFRVSQVDIGTDTVGAVIDDLKVTCN
jgi:hypothetical protein